MSIIISLTIIFAAVFFITILSYKIVFTDKGTIRSRLKKIVKTASLHEYNEAEIFKGKKTKPAKRKFKARVPKKYLVLERYFQKLSGRLERAHLLYLPGEFILLSLSCAVLFALILICAAVLTINAKPVILVLFALIGGITGFTLPLLFLSSREKKQRNLLSSETGNMVLLLANYLRAGHSFTKAIEQVSHEVSSPLSEELKKFVKDLNLGGSLTEALDELENRTSDEDLGLVITAILIHHQVGGNLAEVLDNINQTIRERIRLKGEIKTLTAQGRLSAIIISLLPIVVGIVLSILNPAFVQVLFTEPAGRIMLTIAIFSEITGILLINRIIKIKV
ncbi:MAG: hypothetical protein XD78_0946 [Desulfotomaculum sp. 46_296]|nr:MAG: hypothetical protein XD78_0946 [Desulfotomaculum sp. 46_296]HAU32102.1 secretion system protein [Desulfotomaculum sp.]